MRYLISILATIVVVFLNSPQAMAQSENSTLISCQVGSKSVNVRRINNKYIYTYGKSGLTPEMSIESTGRDGKLFYYVGFYAGGNKFQQLRFVNGNTSYMIYLSTERGKDALLVVVTKESETERKCLSNIDYWNQFSLSETFILEDSADNGAIR